MWIVAIEVWMFRIIKFVIIFVRRLFGRQGFPFFRTSAYGSLEEQEGDLFCGVKERAGTANGKDQVVLRVESISPEEGKYRKRMTSLFVLLGYSSVVILTCLKAEFWRKDALRLLHSDAYSISTVCIATVLVLTPLSVRLGILVHRVGQTLRQGLNWAPRRWQMTSLALVGGAVQLINVMCWIAPHVIVLAGRNKCVWFSPAMNVLTAVRWTCWNTTMLLWAIMAHSLMAWRPNRSGSSKQLSQTSPKLIMDAPWSYHWKKLFVWVLFEVAAVSLAVPSPPYQLPVTSVPGTDCRQWNWNVVCFYSPVIKIPPVGLSFVGGLYAFLYELRMMLAYWQLESAPFRATRAVRVLWCVQAETTFLAFHSIWISLQILWYYKGFSCWSYITSWLGLLPLQIVAAAVAWQNCWLFAPQSPGSDDPVMQNFAWTEAGQTEKVAERNAQAQGKHERAKLTQQPMFCFETALKLHVWSCLVYTDVGQPAKGKDRSTEWWQTELAGCGQEGDGMQPGDESNLEMGQIHATPQPSELCSDDTPPEDMDTEDWESDAWDAENGTSSSPPDSPTADSHASSQPFASALRVGQTAIGMRASTSEPDAGLGNLLGPTELDAQSQATEQSGAELRREERRQQMKRRAVRQLRTGMGEFGLSDMKTFYDKQWRTKALLGWNQHTVVLSFRGTAGWTNAFSDLKVWRMAHEPARGMLWLGTRPMVHTGFYQLWRSNNFGHQVLAHLQQLVEESQVQQDARICLTGHSLGGALAMLAAHDIAIRFPCARLQVYTFGAPRVGNHAFARDFEELVPDTWTVIEECDPVTRAGKFFFLFKRPGHRVLINQKGELVVRPNALELQILEPSRVGHHMNLSYRAAMLAICVAQFSTHGMRDGAKGVLELAESPFVRNDLKHDGLDFHKLRRLSRWGAVGSSRVAPPTPQELRQLLARTISSQQAARHKWRPKAAESPWAKEPRLTLSTLQKYRDAIQEESDVVEIAEEGGCCNKVEEGDSSQDAEEMAQ